jgi:hypothetical protein
MVTVVVEKNNAFPPSAIANAETRVEQSTNANGKKRSSFLLLFKKGSILMLLSS